MNVIIIDDEKQAVASLEMELKEIRQSIKIIGVAHSVKEGTKLLKKVTPDILFLDIRLNDGLGFEVLEKIGNFGKFHVVFTTAYDQYALEAFKHRAFDYLLKPIDLDELEQCIAEIIQRNGQTHKFSEKQLDQIVTLSNAISTEPKIALNTGNGIYIKPLAEIIYIQADGNYTRFIMKGSSRPLLISRPLKDFEDMLSQSGFVRIHYSHLINLSQLHSFHSKDGSYVVMSDKSVLPVSTRKKAGLLEILRSRSFFLL